MNIIPGLLISDGDAGEVGDLNVEDDVNEFLGVFGVCSDEWDEWEQFEVLVDLDDDVEDGVCWYNSTSCASQFPRSIASVRWDLVKGKYTEAILLSSRGKTSFWN